MPKHNYTIRLDDDMRQWLEDEAKKQNRSLANLIEYILTQYLNEHC